MYTLNLPNLKQARLRTTKKVEYLAAANLKSTKYTNKKYYIRTYGCQMNVHDSEEIKGILENLGFIPTTDLEQADIVILNTCSIRENAHDKVFGFLGRLKHLKKNNPNLIICVGGCMPQTDSVANLLKTKYPFVNIVFGTHNINDLGKMILKEDQKQQIEVYSIEGNVYEHMDYVRDSKISAWVNIMYGCDKFCTYCIVPYTRGKQRSRKMEDILEEVTSLKKAGYLEVTLLGQNVNAYGKDLDFGYNFATLLENVAKTGIKRIRFVTSHPWDFTDKMIDVIAKYENIMPYIHLPLQSGSSRLLKLMGRRYTKEEYIALYNKIKAHIPNVSITTDIIVGFPNETNEDFEETLEVVNKCKFDGAFTFIYSPREGTPAALIKDTLSKKTKIDRLHQLNELINSYSLAHNQAYLGKTEEVLVLGPSEKGSNKVYGYTKTMKLVNIDGAGEDIGKLILVTITAAKSFSLDGKKVIFTKN